MSIDVSPTLDEALAWTREGHYVVPIPRGLKRPQLREWEKQRYSADDLPGIFRRPDMGLCVLLGITSVVDVDLDCNEARILAEVLLPPTGRKHGRASAPGSHWWYLVEPAPRTRVYDDPGMVDDEARARILEVRGLTGKGTPQQTNVPPTVHPSGESFTYVDRGAMERVPAALLHARADLIAACVLIARCWPGRGRRHEAALHLAGTLCRRQLDPEAIADAVLAVAWIAEDDEASRRQQDARDTCRAYEGGDSVTGLPQLLGILRADDARLRKLREWLGGLDTFPVIPGYGRQTAAESREGSSPFEGWPEAGIGTPSPNGHVPDVNDRVPAFPRTDAGNAERLVYWHGDSLLYCKSWGEWLVWDAGRWIFDETDAVGRLAIDAMRRIRTVEAEQATDTDLAQLLVKHSYASESDSRVRAAINRAKGLLGARVTDFDTDPWLLNCPNGILDLRTLRLSPHDRGARMTKVTGAKYDPLALCPRWLAFLRRVMDGNTELIAFLQRMAGYCLTGLTVEDVLFFLYGTGRNGKSVFVSTLRAMLGEYARSTRPEVLMVRPNGADNATEIAALVGARFVATTEIEEGARLAESLVKQLTGGDVVTARRLYGHPFDFKPEFKPLIAGNYQPTIRGTDVAIWERVLEVPFVVTIPPEERDKSLREKLEAELSGVLTWAVEGCRLWQRHGLSPPSAVRKATEEYRQEMDTLGQFLRDCCETRHSAVETSKDLYAAYTAWCQSEGLKPWSSQAFGRKLRARGFEPARDAQTRVWQGITVVNVPSAERDG